MSAADGNYASGFDGTAKWRPPQTSDPSAFKASTYIDKKMVVGLAVFVGLSLGLIFAVKTLVGGHESGARPAVLAKAPSGATTNSSRLPAATAEQSVDTGWERLDAPYRNYKVTIEGDSSIKLDGRPAKLYAFNVLPRTRICAYANGERWACGQRAYIALLNIMGSTTIDCRPTKFAALINIETTDTFTCRLPGTDISELLLREGWGTLDGGVVEERYIDAAAAAYQFKTGMWTQTPKTPRL